MPRQASQFTRALLRILAVGVATSSASPAIAQPAPTPASASEAEPSPASVSSPTPSPATVPSTGKRALPDYDGRGEEPADFGDGALWVPRVLAFPFYVISEYVLRRPMSWLVVTAERDDWPAAIMDFFTFGEDQKVGLIPTAFIDSFRTFW